MGGRWNPQGVPVVYLSGSRALAALEIMVHFGRDVALASWVVSEVEIPDEMIDSYPLKNLPTGWDDLASPSISQAFGATWINSKKNLAILLPSAIIPEERSMMVNVRHRDFPNIKASVPVPFYFDPRLGKK